MAARPGAVLFMCSMNTVRSPMAASLLRYVAGKSLYVASAGVRKGEADGFTIAAMDELGLDIAKHRAQTVEELEDFEGFNFDLLVSLSPEAHHKALEFTRTMAVDVEYWPTFDPSTQQGSREQILDAYRTVRDQLLARIRKRFAPVPAAGD
ncbi:low molecular weight phosphatase family protein [Candidatus Raskinella chloraquaticus]|uniref:ArsC family transcriptional regulator n=1 Tax=Candidatus Raskinella chloraquaticus TaxID=1951219 RepID=A0A1W9I2L4_9HYPH|nr:MAG: ArsC family transcriptional regulator [Proteobacteria bacterium SG_bin8]